jgi:hypothetical protein
MRSILAITILVLSTPAIGNGQTWQEYYDRGQYESAAALLHPLVFDSLMKGDPPMPHPGAVETLARMYWAGQGVPQDRIVGCSLVDLAVSATGFWIPTPVHPVVPEHPLLTGLNRLHASTCDTLPLDDRNEAGQMIGCPKFGPDRQVLDIDRRALEIDRRGFHFGGVMAPRAMECFERLVLARQTRVDPAAGAASAVGPRYLVELFSWRLVQPGVFPQRALQWTLVEVLGSKIEWRESKELVREPGPTWLKLEAPPSFSDVRFAMSADGDITWRFNGSRIEGTLAALPERAPDGADDLPRLPSKGRSQVDVTVADHFGRPLEHAKVRLTGVVDRERESSADGRVTFRGLPAGRYDLIASADGLASSAPRVLDLSGADTASLDVVLKPYKPAGMVTIACGGNDPSTIRSLAAGAHAVLHVRVTGQSTADREAGPPNGELTTSNQSQVLHGFKRDALSPGDGSVITIVQGGGRIDRGDYVEFHGYNRLAPLNVGDEYVLFLYRDASGAYGIHGAEEGAFRIRNGRVESPGSGGVAEAWKGRSAAKFFEGLRITSQVPAPSQ